MEKPIYAYAYLRKSRLEEKSEDATLEKHRKTLEEFAARNNIVVLEVYEEVVSGETLYSRPQMLRLLADIEHGKCDAVLCMALDRLGRSSMSEQGVILETLKQNNVKIITPRKVYDLNNDMDDSYSEFESMIARQELKIIKRRLHDGIRRTITDGGYIPNAPYGYEKVQRTKKGEKPTLQIVEQEAAFVRMIFDLYVNQGIGSQTIADTLNGLGAKPRRAERFGRTTVVGILKNPVYIGKIVWDKKQRIKSSAKAGSKPITIYNPPEKWTVTDGIHEPIIDEDTFTRAQEILRGRYHPPYYKGTVENPLAGLVKCGNCGYNMQRIFVHRGGPHEWESLICMRKGCIPSVKLAYIEEAVLNHLRARLEEMSVQLKTDRLPPKDISFLETALSVAERELKTLQQQSDRLHDLLEQGVYDIPTFQRREQTLSERAAELTGQMETQRAAIEKSKGENKKKLCRKIKSVLQAYDAANAQHKNMMLKSVISEIVYHREPKSAARDFSLSIRLRDF